MSNKINIMAHVIPEQTCHPELDSGFIISLFTAQTQIPGQARNDMLLADLDSSVHIRSLRNDLENENDIMDTRLACAAPRDDRVVARRAAFSLVEAMMILLLISVAIMTLIPLMTQKASIPKWVKSTDTDNQYVYYGTQPYERVGISLNPYNENTKAKFSTSSLAVKNSDTALSSVLFLEKYNESDNGSYDSTDRVEPTNSVVIGINACKNAVSNSTIIRSLNSPPTNDCDNGSININDSIIYTNNTLTIQPRDGNPVLVLTSDDTEAPNDTFTFYYPPNTDIAMDYRDSTLTIPQGIVIGGDDGILTLDTNYLNTYNKTISVNATSAANIQCDTTNIYYNCGGTEDSDSPTPGVECQEVTRDPRCLTTSECEEKAYKGNNTCFDSAINNSGIGNGTFFNSYTTPSSEDTDGGNGTNGQNTTVTTDSDRRLKNIIAPYVKGISDISKIETYRFTYKNDKKQTTFIGVIAQKLIGIYDEALHVDEKGYYSYEKTPLLYSMTNAAKEIDIKQKDIAKKQKQTHSEADKLLRLYK